MKRNYLLIFALVLSTVLVRGQVTIGSATAPVSGALLDLKDGGSYGTTGATAKKGMLLPRVKLTDLTKLKMGDNEIENGTTGEHAKHTGLLVFSAEEDKCADKPIGKGLYIWDGAEWQPMGVTIEEVVRAELSITNAPDILHFISGLDKRGTAPVAIAITATWKPNNKNLTYDIQPAYGSGDGDERVIISPSTITGSPVTINLNMKPMTDDDLTAIPELVGGATKGATVDFIITDECGREISKQIILNQTNFVLMANNSKTTSSATAIKTDASEYSFQTKGNSIWTATVKNDNQNIIRGIATVANNTTANLKTKDGGQDFINNGIRTNTLYYRGNAGGTGTKYATADIVFTDRATTKRWNDITVKVMSCLGTPATPEWVLPDEVVNLGTGLPYDGRPNTLMPYTMSWLPSNVPVTLAQSGDLNFVHPLPTSPLSSPTDMQILAHNMTAGDVAASPWLYRHYKLDLTKTDDCGTTTKSVTFKQNHFAMKVNNSFDDTVIAAPLKDTNNKTFTVQSNNTWKATVTDTKGILASTTPSTGGTDNTTGGTSSTTSPTFTYSASPGGVGTKYQTATAKFEDTSIPKRAKDITVTMQTCLGTLDLSGITIVAGHAETTAGHARWGTNVVRHQAKVVGANRIYEEFTSAHFGTAGRWMTTNLSAKAYDGIQHSQASAPANPSNNTPRSLVQHDGRQTNDYNVAFWAYPNNNRAIVANEPASAEYTANPHLGLLYTWDAATAGKGGDTGRKNIYNTSGGEAANQESGFPEGAGTNQQKRVQGVCPAGWHLPSDAEFTALENHIKNNTSNHSSMGDIGGTDTSLGSGTANNIAIGTAMKDVCENGINASKSITESGFSLLPAGNAARGSANFYGRYAHLQCSSSANANFVWERDVNFDYANVYRSYGFREQSYSVRCKKD